MTRIIGALDGTMIRIMRPPKQIDQPYICRKGYPAINCFAACDNRGRFVYFSANFPGSCHDSYILRYSNINPNTRIIRRTKFFQKMESGYLDGVFLGDSAYPLRRWLFTPVRRPADDIEAAYNNRQSSARMVIEKAFGVLKMRWRCLHCELRFIPGHILKGLRLIRLQNMHAELLLHVLFCTTLLLALTSNLTSHAMTFLRETTYLQRETSQG